MKSHIQLPNCILQYFRDQADPEKKVWYLWLSDNSIKRASARKLGTSKGYYSQEMESHLNAHIESPAAELFTKIRRFCEDDKSENITLSGADEIVFKVFLKNLLSRGSVARDSFLKTSLTAQLCSEQNNNDMRVWFGTGILSSIDDILADMRMIILINRSKCNLVAPRNFFYIVPYDNVYCIMAPISPNIALALLPRERFGDFKHNNTYICPEINDEQQIRDFNIYALKYEYAYNKEFIASCSRQEVEELSKYLEDHPTAFLSLHN